MYATVDIFRGTRTAVREETKWIEAFLVDYKARLTSNSIVLSREEDNAVRTAFVKLRKKWVNATFNYSDMYLACQHPAHKAIVDLGMPVVPHLIRDMMTNETHWFFALNLIVGYNAIEKKNVGRIQLMIEDWVKWANDRHLL